MSEQHDTDMALTTLDAAPVATAAQQPAIRLQWTAEDLQALKETVAKDCSAAQFKVFMAAAQRLGLEPMARQIVPIVQGNRMTPQVTIDGFRLIAERTGLYGGQEGPFWCGADGVWHDVWLSDADPVAAKVGVLRRDFSGVLWGVARTKAYKQAQSPTWGRMCDVMIAKVAESLALRKAFPQELSGVYTREELAQAERVGDDMDTPRVSGKVVDATPSATPTGKYVPPIDQARLTLISAIADELGLSADERRAIHKSFAGDLARIHAHLQELQAARQEAAAAQASEDEGEWEFVEEDTGEQTPASLEELPVPQAGRH